MSPDISIDLFNLVVQGGFAALFIWLLMDTRREAKDREAKLTGLLEQYSNNLPSILKAVERIDERVEKLDAKIQQRETVAPS